MTEEQKFNFIIHLVMSKQITGWNGNKLTGQVGYIFPRTKNPKNHNIPTGLVPISVGSGIFHAVKYNKYLIDNYKPSTEEATP